MNRLRSWRGRCGCWPCWAFTGGVIGINNIYGSQFTGEAEHSTIVQNIIEPFAKAPVGAFIGIGCVLVGFLAARKFYLNATTDPLPAKLGSLATAMKNRFYFDEIYEATFVRAHDFLAAVADWIDRWILEGAIIGAIRGGTDLSGRALRLVQTGNLQTYAFLFVLGVVLLLYLVLGK